MMPVLVYNLLQSVEILAKSTRNFARRCIGGLKANTSRINDTVEKSLALCTALSPIIGYDRASKIAKQAYETGKTVREVALEQKILPEEKIDEVLDPRGMTGRE
jgi:fumarate hydratase class II